MTIAPKINAWFNANWKDVKGVPWNFGKGILKKGYNSTKNTVYILKLSWCLMHWVRCDVSAIL